MQGSDFSVPQVSWSTVPSPLQELLILCPVSALPDLKEINKIISLIKMFRYVLMSCLITIFVVTNVFVFVDIPSPPPPLFFPPLLIWGHRHLPQVYPLLPGGNVTDSHSQSPRQQRGVWRCQTAGQMSTGAKVRERDGAEVPVGGNRGGAVIWSSGRVPETICCPPAPAPTFVCWISGSRGGDLDLFILLRGWLGKLCVLLAFILHHPLSSISGIFLSDTTTAEKNSVWPFRRRSSYSHCTGAAVTF